MRTYLFLAIGIAGLVVNALMNVLFGHLRPSENVFGLLVVSSMVLIGAGFVPVLRKWPHARAAAVVMSIALVVYLANCALSVIHYAMNDDGMKTLQRSLPNCEIEK